VDKLRKKWLWLSVFFFLTVVVRLLGLGLYGFGFSKREQKNSEKREVKNNTKPVDTTECVLALMLLSAVQNRLGLYIKIQHQLTG